MTNNSGVDTVRASRAGHTFHERWAARRALQLIFPKDELFAIAVEGLSNNETAIVGSETEDIADLVLYFGKGDNFESCSTIQTLQFKYKTTSSPATSSYLKKTIEKFADTICDYDKNFPKEVVNKKLSFSFVTNGEFSDHLWEAIRCLKTGNKPTEKKAIEQYNYLVKWSSDKNVTPKRLFSRIEFRASTKDLAAQNRSLQQTISDWSAGVDSQTRMRLYGLTELLREKAGLEGQGKNLVKREDVLDSLGCSDPEDLFPADTQFIDVGKIVERAALFDVAKLIKEARLPVFIHADGGVGKTVFIQSLATSLKDEFEVVVFDCFGGGSYRSGGQARHLPSVGLIQIVNELASRGLCDPLLPNDSDRYGLIKAARKRFEQASKTTQEQSNMNGILIVLDAADNAQIEADNRNEDAFPKLLLESFSDKPIDGVTLLLTARPHRKKQVIGDRSVMLFELCPFNDAETKAFLSSRRKNISNLELLTAIARSGGNARVLEYLVESWEQNILGNAPTSEISVEELIGQKCETISKDLVIAGWNDKGINEFFAAISLLPPPIPLDELANALGWSISEVNSAASDLAPMLEMVSHGAIFRDEPTETFIRETYSMKGEAQQAIAERLEGSQSSSMYSAEALPHFLVVIGDNKRAYDLAGSSKFPTSIQSEYGRRRLQLSRLNAAFKLAVKDGDFDRVLSLTMQLAQVASANTKGDQFIRQSPALAAILGDGDASRRLFTDRSGWRGSRNARLSIAYSFSEEPEEANIQQNRAIGWINWYYQSKKNDGRMDRSGPDTSDFAAVVFVNILNDNHKIADNNLSIWNFRFALSVAQSVVTLCEQYELSTGNEILQSLIAYASNKTCGSLALQIALLSSQAGLSTKDYKSISRAASVLSQAANLEKTTRGYSYERRLQEDVTNAALTSILSNSKQSGARILKLAEHERPLSYEYGERHGPDRAWIPVLSAYVGAWAKGEPVTYYHLLPSDVKITRSARKIENQGALKVFLENLEVDQNTQHGKKRRRVKKRQFDHRECEAISSGIELVLKLVRPLEAAVRLHTSITKDDVHRFMEVWEDNLRMDVHRDAENSRDRLARSVGIGLANLLFLHANDVEKEDALKLVKLVSNPRFTTQCKLSVLAILARHPNLHDVAGKFAKEISDGICSDEYIEQRADNYLSLAEALMIMSTSEAQEYYKLGLSQLDQMGGGDYDMVYSILRYAELQPGGHVKPALSHRLMNLCQTIFQYEPSKFGWTLFGSSAANSIGFSALYKLIRWHDQDVADFSYGLPQLASFLAKNDILDARRATILLALCEDHGWHEWQVGKGLSDILVAAEPKYHRQIFSTLFDKLEAEHTNGGWPSLWQSLLDSAALFPDSISLVNKERLQQLIGGSQRKRDEKNLRQKNTRADNVPAIQSGKNTSVSKGEEAFKKIVAACDPTSPQSIDDALQAIQSDQNLIFGTRDRLFESLRERCTYDQRADFTYAVCEATKIEFDDTLDIIIKNIKLWEASTLHLSQNIRKFVEKVFAFKGSELFVLQYNGILKEIRRLVDFCGDADFVVRIVFETVSKEQIELGGDEWLQLAASLCTHTSPENSLAALEDLLSGPATNIGDEIGEGKYKNCFAGDSTQSGVVSDIIWHLLGDEDTFIRWNAARAIKLMADLELFEDIDALFDRFDSVKIAALDSQNKYLSFQNAQQWFLMGLSRAALHHKKNLAFLKKRLEALENRSDLHVVNKIHVARCLWHISGIELLNQKLRGPWDDLYNPPHGYVERDGWPAITEAKTNFSFDYDFEKYEISDLARLFGISNNEAQDAIANEIIKKWPDATDMNYFHGKFRFNRSGTERYETYREHVQRHALLSAASLLVQSKPVLRSGFGSSTSEPWVEWLEKYDVTFEDGSWLSDRKNYIPKQATSNLLGDSTGNVETLKAPEVLHQIIGFPEEGSEQPIPLYGHWKSCDGVYVRFVAALIKRKGSIGQCAAFSKRPDHDIWLPTFGFDGREDRISDHPPFKPFIWEPEKYPMGIDEGDELATRGAATRPRLGIDITSTLGISPDSFLGEWRSDDGALAMKSQVWGGWEPDQDQRQQSIQNEGVILWASPEWLENSLTHLDQSLVYHVTFSKSPSRHDYDDSSGVKGVFIGLKAVGKPFRVWKATKASKTIY